MHWDLAHWVLSVCLLLWLTFPVLATGQSEPDSTDPAARQLNGLRREIQEVEQKLRESRSREKNLLEELNDFDREISLRSELITRLKSEQKKAQQVLDISRRELVGIQGDLQKTRVDSQLTASEKAARYDLVKRRAVYAYKHFRREALKAMLTSQSLLQWLTRQRYLNRLVAMDRRNLQTLEQKNLELATHSQRLAQRHEEESTRLQTYRAAADYHARLVAESNREAAQLKKRRTERLTLLKRLQKDRESLAQQLEIKKQAAARVESLIRNLETRRETKTVKPLVEALTSHLPFAQQRGKLHWPTQGKIVGRFGLQRHEKLATVTENPGIDIAAAEGSPVISVSSGEITKITWLRGYGNTVIIDHHDGYYTVYAHLDQIQVREGQRVAVGETIGQVGQTGSISGPRLHFEIWAKREKQNPLDWLASK